MKAIYDAALRERGKSQSGSTPAKMKRTAEDIRHSLDNPETADPITKLYGSVRRLLDNQQTGIVLHMVAATVGEGVSTISRGLAFRAGTAGHRRVLLMDGHAPSRRNESGTRGLLASLADGGNIGEHVQSVPASDVFACSLAGAEGVTSWNVKDILNAYEECRKEFELTIVDCPAVSSGRYFDLVPECADGIILVVQAEKLRPVVIQHAKDLLEEQGGKIVGVVLNKTKRYIPNFVYKFI